MGFYLDDEALCIRGGGLDPEAGEKGRKRGGGHGKAPDEDASLVLAPWLKASSSRGESPIRDRLQRVLGVDDLALRRGQRYATILVNLETSEPVDLLSGREAGPLAEWLRAHPGVEVIVRDRSEAYAAGAKARAPNAVQVADRFHLVKNASAAMDELLQGQRRQIAVEVSEPPPAAPAAKPLSPTKQRMADRRAARVARWEEVQRRHKEGEGLRHSAREMGISRVTVRRLIDTPIPPRNHIVHPRPGGLTSPSLQPYVSYLQDRWQQGCHNITQLFREIGEQGYPGRRSLLYTALHGWRGPRPPPKERRRCKMQRFSVRWLCLRPPDQLKSEESLALQQILEEDTRLATGYDLLQRFRALLTERDVAALATWLRDAQASNLAPFAGMANGIANDRAADEAALTMPWSTSMVEGHIHRVKLIKRQGYRRSSLTLLRRRIVAA
ncbi:MAG TPA: ISL3 family transposase [Chloroflexota bacterium]|nr:ISL3 family transposase [Chloroflexota bacterium]